MEEECEKEVDRKLKDIQEQKWRVKLESWKFAKKIKIIIGKEKGVYEKKMDKKYKKRITIIARFRLGSETDEAKYWKKEKKDCVEYVERKCLPHISLLHMY